MRHTVTVTVIHDDIDGTPDAARCTFALDGVTYEIDLSADNHTRLYDALDPYLTAARRVSGQQRHPAPLPGQRRRSALRTTQTPAGTATVRAWWKRNPGGLPSFNPTGRVPKVVVDAFQASTVDLLGRLATDEARRGA